jgi:hypothetical protein
LLTKEERVLWWEYEEIWHPSSMMDPGVERQPRVSPVPHKSKRVETQKKSLRKEISIWVGMCAFLPQTMELDKLEAERYSFPCSDFLQPKIQQTLAHSSSWGENHSRELFSGKQREKSDIKMAGGLAGVFPQSKGLLANYYCQRVKITSFVQTLFNPS